MAEEHHPQCVLLAPEVRTAQALAAWLTEKGFPAEFVAPNAVAAPGDSLGFSEEAFTGIEVRVIDPEHIEPAKRAIEEMREEVVAVRSRQEKRAERIGTVSSRPSGKRSHSARHGFCTMAASIAAESAAGAMAESAIASMSSNQDCAAIRVPTISRLAEGSAAATASGK